MQSHDLTKSSAITAARSRVSAMKETNRRNNLSNVNSVLQSHLVGTRQQQQLQQPPLQRQRSANYNRAAQSKDSECFRCGSSAHFAPRCPHIRTKCYGCGKIGHIAPVCMSSARNAQKRNTKARQIALETQDYDFEDVVEETTPFCGEENEVDANIVVVDAISYNASTAKVSSKPTPRMCIKVNDANNTKPALTLDALPDSGATGTVISLNIVKKNRIPISPKGNTKLVAANGQEMACEGVAPLRIQYGKRIILANAVVTSSMENDLLIGWQDLKSLGVLPDEFPKPSSF